MPREAIDLRLDLAWGLDPVVWARDRLHFDPDDWQAGLLRSDARQIIENITRQGGKSTSAAAKALHVALYDAPALVPLVSPSQRQSQELFGKVVEFMRALEPAEPTEEDNKLSVTLGNGSRIVSLPGDPKTVRGLSAPKLIIVDEAAFVDPAMFAALRPMLATSGGQLILISTPNGRQGYFFETWERGEGWERFRITAQQCARISADYLEQERRELGPMLFSQEYLCEFIDAETSAFSSEMLELALADDFERLMVA
jgi:Helicase